MKKFLGFLATIIIIAIIILAILFFKGGLGFGNGLGFGSGTGESESVVSQIADSKTAETDSSVIVIKVYEDKIFYNGEEVSDMDELKKLISDDAAEGATFTFEQEYGIKATLDEVKALLTELEKSIDIQVKGLN